MEYNPNGLRQQKLLICLIICISLLVIVLIISLYFGFTSSFTKVSLAATTETTAATVLSTAADTPLPAEPENGFMWASGQGEDLAPLSVTAPYDTSCVISMSRIRSKFYETDYIHDLYKELSNVRFYIRAGSTVEINIPLGEYEIYCAAGKVWHGPTELFGEDTVCSKLDGTFLFQETSGGYSGFSLELQPITHGNLDSEEISIDDFPR